MTESLSYVVSEREYEALAVIRDIILLVSDELEANIGRESSGLAALRSCAMEEVMRAELSLFHC